MLEHSCDTLDDREPRPVVGARASLHGDAAAWLAGEKSQHLLAPELLAEDNSSGRTRAMCLEHVLVQIQADGANLFHGRSPVMVLKRHHLGTSMPSAGVHMG